MAFSAWTRGIFGRGLGAERAHLAAIIESSEDAIISKTLDGIVTSWNRAAEDMFGYASREIVGRSIALLFPPDRIDEEQIIVERVTQGEKVAHFETVRRRKDGRDFPVSLTISPIRDRGGKIIGASKIARDISQRRRAEAALSAAEERLRSVVEGAPHGFIMVRRSGAIEMVNAETERMFGYRRDELIGQPIEMLLPERLAGQHPTLRHSYFADARVRRMGVGRDLYGLHKNRSEFPIEIGLNPLSIDSETVVLAAVVDITERKRMQQALQEGEAEYRRIVDESPLGIILINLDGLVFEQVNRTYCQMLGYAASELIGRTVDAVTHPDDRTIQREEIVRHGRSGISFEKRYLSKSGKIVWVQISSTFLSDRDKAPTRALGFVEDITRRKQVEAELLQAQKMEAVGQLTGGIAHDFNNLLAIVLGNVELVKGRLAADAEASEMIGDALRAARRGASLTHQLLAYSRQQSLLPKILSLSEVVSEIAQLLRRTLGENIDIKVVMAADLWRTYIDPHQLENALLNLAVNARDAMPNGGRLTIEGTNTLLDEIYAESNIEVRPGPYVRLSVTDTGTGIPKDVIGRVLEPFFTTKAIGKGSGLGLSMVYGFVKQSGGHIKVYSEPNHGTTVNLYFPKAQGDAADYGPRDDDLTPLPRAIAGETILVVEDEEMVRKLVIRILSGLGYQTISASDGIDALAALERIGRVDLMLTDVVLPKELDGPALVRKAHESRPDLKVIYMTGYARDAILSNGNLEEDVRLLTKPIPQAELARRLREALDDPVKR